MTNLKIEDGVINVDTESYNTIEVQVQIENDATFDAQFEETTNEIDATMESDQEMEVKMNSGIINVSSNKHNELQNRNLPDQHPIESISGLKEALDSKSMTPLDNVDILALLD